MFKDARSAQHPGPFAPAGQGPTSPAPVRRTAAGAAPAPNPRASGAAAAPVMSHWADDGAPGRGVQEQARAGFSGHGGPLPHLAAV